MDWAWGLAGQASDAVSKLKLDRAAGTILQERSTLRSVRRFGEVVLKVYAASESEYWEREVAAYSALAHSNLALRLVDVGELWIATEWAGLKGPSPAGGGDLSPVLGAALASLHSVDARSLPRLPIGDRLDRWLRESPCPPALASAVEAMTTALRGAYRESHFVHGDWGASNVLLSEEGTAVVKVLDFEGAHLGDPAEDFKWQLIEGTPWSSHRQMLDAYAAAGGELGPNATERLVLSAAEWALDLLAWRDSHGNNEFHDRALSVLEALVCEEWPPS